MSKNVRRKHKDGSKQTILPVSSIPLVYLCERRFYYHIRFKHDKKKKGVSKTDTPNKKNRITNNTYQQKLFSSESLQIRGMCKFESNTHPPVPIVQRNRLDEQPWELAIAEIQLALYALLLAENKTAPVFGLIKDQRNARELRVPLKVSLIQNALLLIGRAQAISEMEYAPPGCEGSYCTTCRQYVNCYSKLITTMQGRPADDAEKPEIEVPFSKIDSLPLYVLDQGARITTNDRIFSITKDDKVLNTALPMDVSNICIYGNVQITTQAITKALRESIPIVFMSRSGNFKGMATPFTTINAQRRRSQFTALDNPEICRIINSAIVSAKIRNCRNLLRRNANKSADPGVNELTYYANKSDKCTITNRLRGYEGTAARIYFSFFNHMLHENAINAKFSFTKRTRRPPKDPINAMLSFGYALLLKDIIIALELAGLDPMHGFYHISRHSRPALALDIMDSFRPLIVDSVVLSLVNNGRIGKNDFEKRDRGTYFARESSKKLIAEYERRLATKLTDENTGQKIILRTAIYRTAESLALFLSGKQSNINFITSR